MEQNIVSNSNNLGGGISSEPVEKATITVIVPVFNAEKYLHKCLDSIVNSTHRNLQVILIDDGSADSSGTICDDFAKIDARVTVVHQKNKGSSAARNRGLDMATGDFIIFCDADDYVDKKMYEILLRRIYEDNSDCALCDFYYVQSDSSITSNRSNRFGNAVWDQNQFWNEFYFNKNHVHCVLPTNKLFKAYCYENVRFIPGEICDDERAIYPLISRCNRISCVDDKLYYYVQHSDSVMGSRSLEKNCDRMHIYLDRAELFLNSGNTRFATVTLEYMIPMFHLASKNDDLQIELNGLYKKYRELYWKVVAESKRISWVGLSFALCRGLDLHLRNIYRKLHK